MSYLGKLDNYDTHVQMQIKANYVSKDNCLHILIKLASIMSALYVGQQLPLYLEALTNSTISRQVQHSAHQRSGHVRRHVGHSVHQGQGSDPVHVDHRALVAHGHLPELGR